MKKISIVMRSRNDAEFAERTINAILSQTEQDFELLSFDNASTDGTAEIIAKYPQIKKFKVPEGAYVPGRVLNAAVAECEGGIIVFNNADAIPQNNDWLAEITRAIAGGECGACYARQICRPNANAWVSADYARAFGDTAQNADFFSMASSAAAADILKKYPFDADIKYSEDVFWAKNLREHGIRVCYAPNAVVEHSHNYDANGIAKRFAGEGAADAQIYGTPQSFFKMLKGILGALVRDFVFCIRNKKITQFIECARARFIQKTSYYKARRNALKSFK